MIDYIGVATIARLVAARGIGPFLEGLAAEIHDAYARWPDFEKSVRQASHSAHGVIELMPISDGQTYAFKYVNGHPANPRDGLLTVTAFGVLADVASGYPLLLSEMTLATALRTAAMSALAARAMARPESTVMALVGNGAQAEFQAIAFHHLCGIRALRLFDTDPRATRKLERHLAALRLPGLTVVACRSTAEAVDGADIVTTVTADKRNATILLPGMIQPGMHLNAVGGDCPGKTELHAEILRRDDARIVVEYAPQSRVEGEIQQLEADFPVIEFERLVSGSAVARRSAADVTIFDSVGFAIEDFATLHYLHRRLRASDEPRRGIDLVPDLRDPKDLFAALDAPRHEHVSTADRLAVTAGAVA